MLDFGIAKLMGTAPAGTETRADLVLGTLAYMSPEQQTGDHPVTAASDLYSLGRGPLRDVHRDASRPASSAGLPRSIPPSPPSSTP